MRIWRRAQKESALNLISSVRLAGVLLRLLPSASDKRIAVVPQRLRQSFDSVADRERCINHMRRTMRFITFGRFNRPHFDTLDSSEPLGQTLCMNRLPNTSALESQNLGRSGFSIQLARYHIELDLRRRPASRLTECSQLTSEAKTNYAAPNV